jgi:hypothetical protein
MSGELLRSDLIQLYNLLVMKLTPKDISWLKEHRPINWENIDFSNRQIIIHPSGNIPYVKEVNDERDYMNKADISFRIQDMIDAINNKTESTYHIELTRPMMEALAIIFGIQDKPHRNKFQILGALLALKF